MDRHAVNKKVVNGVLNYKNAVFIMKLVVKILINFGVTTQQLVILMALYVVIMKEESGVLN